MFGGGLLATLGTINACAYIVIEFLIITPILLIGDQHRKQRKILNPVFHISHMRQMLPIFYQVTYKVGIL